MKCGEEVFTGQVFTAFPASKGLMRPPITDMRMVQQNMAAKHRGKLLVI